MVGTIPAVDLVAEDEEAKRLLHSSQGDINGEATDEWWRYCVVPIS